MKYKFHGDGSPLSKGDKRFFILLPIIFLVFIFVVIGIVNLLQSRKQTPEVIYEVDTYEGKRGSMLGLSLQKVRELRKISFVGQKSRYYMMGLVNNFFCEKWGVSGERKGAYGNKSFNTEELPEQFVEVRIAGKNTEGLVFFDDRCITEYMNVEGDEQISLTRKELYEKYGEFIFYDTLNEEVGYSGFYSSKSLQVNALEKESMTIYAMFITAHSTLNNFSTTTQSLTIIWTDNSFVKDIKKQIRENINKNLEDERRRNEEEKRRIRKSLE